MWANKLLAFNHPLRERIREHREHAEFVERLALNARSAVLRKQYQKLAASFLQLADYLEAHLDNQAMH